MFFFTRLQGLLFSLSVSYKFLCDEISCDSVKGKILITSPSHGNLDLPICIPCPFRIGIKKLEKVSKGNVALSFDRKKVSQR
jgi:hypothetical protein